MTPDDRIALAERFERRALLADETHFHTPLALAQEIRDGSFWENDDD